MKLVYTVKPPAADENGKYEAWYKRKASIVICGNLAEEDAASMYASTAPAEVVRAGLVYASKHGWMAGV